MSFDLFSCIDKKIFLVLYFSVLDSIHRVLFVQFRQH